MYKAFNFNLLRFFSVFLLVFVLFLTLTSNAYAEPSETGGSESTPSTSEAFIDDPDAAFVELKVEIPDGFRGSVSAILKNKETGKTYTITSYRVNFYSNSIQLPFGVYSVEQVYTSENSMTYEAFIDEDEFTLSSNYTLHAKVLFNESGASYVDGSSDLAQNPSDNDPKTGSSSQEQDSDILSPDNTSDSGQPSTSDVSTPDDNDNSEKQQNTPTNDQSESKGSVVTYILKVIIGTAVFVGIVFGVVYIVRKKQGL